MRVQVSPFEIISGRMIWMKFDGDQLHNNEKDGTLLHISGKHSTHLQKRLAGLVEGKESVLVDVVKAARREWSMIASPSGFDSTTTEISLPGSGRMRASSLCRRDNVCINTVRYGI